MNTQTVNNLFSARVQANKEGIQTKISVIATEEKIRSLFSSPLGQSWEAVKSLPWQVKNHLRSTGCFWTTREIAAELGIGERWAHIRLTEYAQWGGINAIRGTTTDGGWSCNWWYLE